MFIEVVKEMDTGLQVCVFNTDTIQYW